MHPNRPKLKLVHVQWVLQLLYHGMITCLVLLLISNTTVAAWSSSSESTTRQQQQHTHQQLQPSRRNVLEHSTATFLGSAMATLLPVSSPVLATEEIKSTVTTIHHPYHYSDTWTGTNLPLLTLPDAVASVVERGDTTDTSIPTWNMGQWPDPILRRPAETVNGDTWFGTDTLHQACQILKTTADYFGAVGLAAQQCGVNARIVYVNLQPTTTRTTVLPTLQRLFPRQFLTSNPQQQQQQQQQMLLPNSSSSSNQFLMMINPTIVQRSPESEMMCWTEECLVLPPSFRATLLRDQWVDVHYWNPMGHVQNIKLRGELARCFQHELDHDRGILTLDHISLEEMESDTMKRIEADGHESRMLLAYERNIQLP